MKTISGNIFDPELGMIVVPVNCVGLIRSRIMVEFEKRLPEHCECYKQLCRDQKISLGRVVILNPNDGSSDARRIVLLPTRHHPSELVNEMATRIALLRMRATLETSDVQIGAMVFPAIGCGSGGMKLDAMKAILYRTFGVFCHSRGIEFVLYSPWECDKK